MLGYQSLLQAPFQAHNCLSGCKLCVVLEPRLDLQSVLIVLI